MFEARRMAADVREGVKVAGLIPRKFVWLAVARGVASFNLGHSETQKAGV